MVFLRVFQHLLPRSQAWRTTTAKKLRSLFEGLAEEPARIRQYYDQIYEDLFPDTTRELEQWEAQFGILPNANEATRRLNLAAEWKAGGGQSAAYIESVLQTAGFPVYVHEWWDPNTLVTRDPHDYTDNPLFGTNRCAPQAFSNQRRCSAFASQARCNRFLNNDVHYIVNKDLTRRAPPSLPTDANSWPFFFYVGGATFPNSATIPASRRAEFERLLLKLRPLHLWIVTLIEYDDIFDDTFDFTFG